MLGLAVRPDDEFGEESQQHEVDPDCKEEHTDQQSRLTKRRCR